MKRFEALYECLETELNTLNYSYQKPAALAKTIQKASSFYIEKKGQSPWEDKDFTAAYLAHFLPMNIMRIIEVIERLKNTSFNINQIVDFGAGPLSFLIASMIFNDKGTNEYFYIEPGKRSSEIGSKIAKDLALKLNLNLPSEIKKINHSELSFLYKTHSLVLSYSLNEIEEFPADFLNFNNLIIIEPSTQSQSRNLLQLRKSLIQKEFHIHAPCTHDKNCPLLEKSKKDWCFDRTHIEIPELAKNLYQILSFDTQQLTFSYLCLSKSKPVNALEKLRVVGDWQDEKGKKKIMICRNEDREFISVLKKNKDTFLAQRGDLIPLDFKYEIKSNELRLSPGQRD